MSDEKETGSPRPRKTIFHWHDNKLREDAEKLARGQQGKMMIGQGVRSSYKHMASEALVHASSAATWSKSRLFLLHVLDSNWYSVTIGIVILLNTILVIYEVDSRASGPGVPGWVTVAAGIFLAVYIVEIVIRFYVFRSDFFQNIWNVLDLMVIVTDICAEFAALAGFGGLPSISVLRIFRLVRLARLIAIFCVFPELQTMLLGFGSAMKAMVWAALMIGVVLTVCSICAVIFIHPLNLELAEAGVYKDCERCGRAFETVAESNLTFIAQIIAGDSWSQITVPLIEAHPLTGVFFLLVFSIIDLGVINLVLMVIVNAAETAREKNQDLQFRRKLEEIEKSKHMMKNLCKDLDSNDDGRISLEEFMEGLDKSEALRRAMAALDIQRQDAEIIFYLMDADKSGDVDFHEFVGTLVATKHESLNTKLLFLKASLHQIYKDLTIQGQVLEEEMQVDTEQLSEVVREIQDDASSKIDSQCNEIMNECQSLTKKLDQRWEELQVEQAKNCQMLEWVVGEMLLPPPGGVPIQRQPEAQASAREPSLPTPSMPPANTPSGKEEQSNGTRPMPPAVAPDQAEQPKGPRPLPPADALGNGTFEQTNPPRWCARLCNTNQPAFALRHVPVSPERHSDMVRLSQHGLVVPTSALSGSVK